MKRLFLALLTLLPLMGQAQALTQADFTGVLVPQYLSNGNNNGATTFPGPRLAVVFRATVANLTPSTAYRYFVQAATQTEFGNSASGAGVVLLITPGATPAATTYTSVSTGSLTTAGSYATFTTDATGNYTGWFGFVNSNNASRFQTPGTMLFPTITLATDAAPATIVARRALNQSLTLLGFSNTAGANNGTLLTGSSLATPKNLVYTYDNVAGTGRPLSGALVENAGVVTGTTQAGSNAYTYNSIDNGSYTTVIPNTLPTGLRRVEQRSIVDNSIVGCASDADGVWPSGANTVNPAGGAGAAVVLTATDTPLNTSACGGVATASVLATPAGPLTFSAATGTASAEQTVTVSGSSLTAALVVTASAGYEVATAAAGPYSASATLTPASGTVAATPVYVRLASTPTAGAANGTLTIASTGATSQVITLNGTVAAPTAAPTITSFTPATGPVGTTVTVTGTNFTGATGATLNGVAVANFMFMSATSVMFDVPAGATTGTIAVTTPGGTGTSATVFTVTTAAPTITGFTPTTGAAGATVTVTGTNLTGATSVTVGGVAITGFTVVNATTITFMLPAAAVTGPIVVTTAGGTVTSTGTFTVTVAAVTPVISTLTPGVQVAGGAPVTLMITGTGFTPTSTVNFNGVSYPQTTSTATSIEAVIPASALTVAGSYPVTVTNAAGTSNAFNFTVNNPSTAGAYENFETGTKGSYGVGTVTLASGIWTFSDALIGTAFNDRANGLKSARIRVGFIRMDFDKPNGAGTVIVNAGTFGNDTGGSFILEKSIDQGTTFTTVPGAPAVLTSTLTPYTFTVNQVGNVRFRITSTATATTSRINIDDISITNFIGSATLASQALPGLSVFPNPATDRLTVSLPTSAPATVALRDLTGRIVLAPATLAADKQLRLPAALASGVYLLEVNQGGVIAVRRIEKN